MKKILSLDAIVVLLMYTEKLFCSNSNINQEAIRQQWLLESNQVATMKRTNQWLEIMINIHY